MCTFRCFGTDLISNSYGNINFEKSLYAISGFIMDDEAPESMRSLRDGFFVITCGNSGELLIEFKFIMSFLLYRRPVENFGNYRSRRFPD